MSSLVYPSDLSDREWALLEPLLPPSKPVGRPRCVNLRRILNGVFYLLRTGCAWRYLPRDYGLWSTVFHYFRLWRRAGTWEHIHTALRERVRRAVGREPTSSAAIIDSQSVKTTEQGGLHGYDGGKKVNRCKQHILVDTLSHLLKVIVHPASVQDREGAKLVLAGLQQQFLRLVHLCADQAYTGPIVDWIELLSGLCTPHFAPRFGPFHKYGHHALSPAASRFAATAGRYSSVALPLVLGVR